MTKGRGKQMRMHAVHQASMVWAMFGGEMRREQLQQFIETGAVEEAQPERIPYDPSILQDLQKRAQ